MLIEDYKIRDYIKKNILNSGVSQVVIERTSKKCIVSIYTSRPGFVIGKKGSDVDKIKKNISKISSSAVSLNIKEVKKPELNAFLVADNISQQLVKRISYRRAMKRAMQSTLRLGAKGRASGIKKPYSNITIILSENISKKGEIHGTKS